MTTYVICKNCQNKIEAKRPEGNVQVQGNVKYGGVRFEGSSIVFGPGGELNFGPGGGVSFGTNSSSRITCPVCGKTFDYSLNDFNDEDIKL